MFSQVFMYLQIEFTFAFKRNHVVECYIIKDDVVVARDFIDVPITTNRYSGV